MKILSEKKSLGILKNSWTTSVSSCNEIKYCRKVADCSTAKSTAISSDFLVWKFCGKAQFPHSFGRFARNCAETVPFRKISTPGNQVEVWYFLHFRKFKKFYCCTLSLTLWLWQIIFGKWLTDKNDNGIYLPKVTIEILKQGVKYFTPCSSDSIINFEHIIAGWVNPFFQPSLLLGTLINSDLLHLEHDLKLSKLSG